MPLISNCAVFFTRIIDPGTWKTVTLNSMIYLFSHTRQVYLNQIPGSIYATASKNRVIRLYLSGCNYDDYGIFYAAATGPLGSFVSCIAALF